MQFYQEKDEDVADGFSSNPSTGQKDVMPGEARMLSMITQFIEGHRWYFSS